MIEHIHDNIYIGNSEDAANPRLLQERKIRAVINCMAEAPVLTGFMLPYCHIKILPEHEFTAQEAGALINFYEMYKNDRILIHCHMGIERSPSVAILLLMHKGFTFEQAHKIVKTKRTEAEIRIYENVRDSLDRITFGKPR